MQFFKILDLQVYLKLVRRPASTWLEFRYKKGAGHRP